MSISAEEHSGHFFGVYLLCSQSLERHYKGRCYIGYTVNPNRRLNQHNRGKKCGGARKTDNRGPWKMVMIVHGFPNKIIAMQFEWAWQNPRVSLRLKSYRELHRKKPRETYFEYNFRILSRMLVIGPWNRLTLTVRWLETDYQCDFPSTTLPPPHVLIASGSIAIKKLPQTQQGPPGAISGRECHLCMQHIDNPQRSRIRCSNKFCKLTCHIICLANHMISSDGRNTGHYIPIVGECPLCETQLVWGELLHLKRKMQGIIEEDYDSDRELAFDTDEEIPPDDKSVKTCEIYELSD